ncbi:PTS sugar transporter subunit IIA [Calditerrivibrio sp.]|uniref:PTS sugar transporter subunit IIA n=2 Tax=Calditerrivibrio sp. TaxID=2792612 RepID=UPI003D1011BC
MNTGDTFRIPRPKRSWTGSTASSPRRATRSSSRVMTSSVRAMRRYRGRPNLVWEKVIEKEDAIKRLLDSCREIGKGWMGSALKSVLDREKQSGTFVGEDVAIPHA